MMASQRGNASSSRENPECHGHDSPDRSLFVGQVNTRDHTYVHLGDVYGNVVYNYGRGDSRFALTLEDASSLASSTSNSCFVLTSKLLETAIEVHGCLWICQRHATKRKVLDLSIASLQTPCLVIYLKLQAIRDTFESMGTEQLGTTYHANLLHAYKQVLEKLHLPVSSLRKRLQPIGIHQHTPQICDNVLRQFQNDPGFKALGYTLQDCARSLDLLSNAFERNMKVSHKLTVSGKGAQSIFESFDADAESLYQSLDGSLHISQTPAPGDVDETPIQSPNFKFAFDAELADSPVYRRGNFRDLFGSWKVQSADEIDISISNPCSEKTARYQALGQHNQADTATRLHPVFRAEGVAFANIQQHTESSDIRSIVKGNELGPEVMVPTSVWKDQSSTFIPRRQSDPAESLAVSNKDSYILSKLVVPRRHSTASIHFTKFMHDLTRPPPGMRVSHFPIFLRIS